VESLRWELYHHPNNDDKRLSTVEEDDKQDDASEVHSTPGAAAQQDDHDHDHDHEEEEEVEQGWSRGRRIGRAREEGKRRGGCDTPDTPQTLDLDWQPPVAGRVPWDMDGDSSTGRKVQRERGRWSGDAKEDGDKQVNGLVDDTIRRCLRWRAACLV
jgi:hypothetical protein